MLGLGTRSAASKPMSLFIPVNLNSPAADLSQYLDSPAVSTVPTPHTDAVFNVADSLDTLVKNSWLAAQLGRVYPTAGKPSAGATTLNAPTASTTALWVIVAGIVAVFAFRAL